MDNPSDVFHYTTTGGLGLVLRPRAHPVQQRHRREHVVVTLPAQVLLAELGARRDCGGISRNRASASSNASRWPVT